MKGTSKKIFVVSLIMAAFGLQSANATCLSHAPNACQGGGYNAQVVANYYKNLFTQQYQSYAWEVNPDTGETVIECIDRCEADFLVWVEACNGLSDSGVPSARWICRLNAESEMNRCLNTCRVPR